MQVGMVRVWHWRVGLLALGAALLLPASGFAQTEDMQRKIGELLTQQRTNAAQAAERDKLQADMKMLEATLQQKLKEVQEMHAQIQKLSATLKEAQAGRPAPGAKLAGQLDGVVLSFIESKPVEEIHLRKVGDKWEVVQPKPFLLESPRSVKPLPGKPAGPQPEIHFEGLEMRFGPPAPPAPPTPPGSRIDELEKKIDRALQQLEQMRREMKGGRAGVELRPEGAFETDGIRLRIEPKP